MSIYDTCVLARNIKMLMEHHQDSQKRLAKRSGISQRTISNILNPDCGISSTLDKIAAIAGAYRLETWRLLIPEVPLEVLMNSSIEKLVDNFVHCEQESRSYLLHVSEREATYRVVPPQNGALRKTG